MAKKKPVVSSGLSLFSETVLNDGTASLTVLKERCESCVKCGLSSTRTRVVFGEGAAAQPAITFVGEGPGENEDRTGRPFVGRAGDLLNAMLEKMGYRREEVYICNVVACRPPNNRLPEEDEVKACSEFLTGQLSAVKPKIIVALGATSAKALTKSTKPLAELRGQWHEWNGIPLRATYHPAYLLRNPSMKTVAWEDLQRVLKKLNPEVV
jgi:DNA polymerase